MALDKCRKFGRTEIVTVAHQIELFGFIYLISLANTQRKQPI
ncbi:protein of unknown function [Candidatus Nitrosocosmicus franklandus]|uniref:Uncharacterized protein n=1 Tax=Candidatus Nitrosocosmicus franklandianus TaxID=1798806 RepID=A0A484I4T4_9ARCH|nr:protein of unknown function [Candidatus Nitrosocosmicus franklandus]